MIFIRKCFPLTVTAVVLAVTSLGLGQSPQVAISTGETNTIKTVAPEKDSSLRTAGISRPESLNLSRAGVQTAQPIPLSLVDAIRRALESNNTIEVTRGDVRLQETRVMGLRGIYDPIFTATPNFTQNQTTGGTATHDFRVNTNLSQFIGPGGGNYQAFFNNSRTENAFAQAQVTSGSISSGSSAIYSSSLGVNYTQPLFRNFSIDSRRQQLRIAKKRLEQTDFDFRRGAIDTINQVQRVYWDLVFALRDQQNRVANVNLARENLRQIEAKIEAGAAAPLERAEVATELANRESDLIIATQQVSITENSLKQLLLRDAVSAEWAESIVPTDQPTVALDPVDMDAALKDAMDNRYELRRLKLERDINQIDIKYFKNQTKPQIDLNTTFSLDGFARNGSNSAFTTNLFTSTGDLRFFDAINQLRGFHGLPSLTNDPILIPASPTFLFGNFNRSLSNLFRSDAPNYSIGVTISFPFRNRTAKANLAGARVVEEQLQAQTRSEEQVVVVEVRNAVQAVETSRQRVLTARRARENAEIQLEGERKLYEAGKSTTFLLFQRENALTNARNAEIRAETDYKKSVADLQRATSTTFREYNIEVQSPLDKK
jgi:HAE1 family hydrophobic/amphiphilic exporter-1